MRWYVFLLALLFVVPGLADTLCIVEKKDQPCSVVEGSTVAVAAAEVARPFIWSSTDGTRVVLGAIPAKASSMSIDDKALSTVTLTLHGDRRRAWPATTHVTLASTSEQWELTLSAKVVEKLRTIRVPAGSYRMSTAAEHHITDKRTLNAAKNIVVGDITLKPSPVVSGRVLNTKEEPIGGAQLVRSDGRVQAIADEQGQFRSELAEPLPDEVVVTQVHFASAPIPLHDLSGDVDLGIIHLSAGAKLTLRLVRAEGVNTPLRARLLRENPTKYEPTPVAVRETLDNDDQLTFTDLSAGTYVVLVEGKEPLQRLSKKIEIKESDVDTQLRIAPFHLDGSVRIGEEPLHGGSIELQDAVHSWRTSVPVDDGGRFGGSMWQSGKVAGFLTAPNIHELVRSPDLGADPSAWDITFKSRYIRGRIFEDDTRQPVSQPSLRLQITSGENQSNSMVPVQEDGGYSILAVKAGTYDLRVDAPDHVPAKATVNVSEEDTPERQIDIPLVRGVQLALDLAWPSGEAVAGATVLEGIATDGLNPERTYTTDGTGRVTLNLRRGDVKTLYVLPREGSFTVAHVVAPEKPDAGPVQVIVPPPGGALRAEMRDANDQTVPAMLLFRFNGELIPQPVIMRLTGQYQSAPMLRVPSLPAGAYELWAVTLPPYQYATLAGRVPNRPPLRVGLTAGEQVVKLVAAPLN
ncbi:MAG: hypothetical protein JWO56_3691 [Acidobacteria bacterium]|nr:hypothetical protein [Acidobacteriota bacterium]